MIFLSHVAQPLPRVQLPIPVTVGQLKVLLNHRILRHSLKADQGGTIKQMRVKVQQKDLSYFQILTNQTFSPLLPS